MPAWSAAMKVVAQGRVALVATMQSSAPLVLASGMVTPALPTEPLGPPAWSMGSSNGQLRAAGACNQLEAVRSVA